MNYINNWITQITAPLPAGATVLPISPIAASRLDLTNGGKYWLTLTNSANPIEQTQWEIVEVSSGLAIRRGMDGTTAQEWPADTLIYCAVSAGQLAELQSRINDLESSGGGGLPFSSGGVLPLEAPLGNTLFTRVSYADGPAAYLSVLTIEGGSGGPPTEKWKWKRITLTDPA